MDSDIKIENRTAEPQHDHRHQNYKKNELKRKASYVDIIKHENLDVDEVINDPIGSGGQCEGVFKIRNINGDFLALKMIKKDDTEKVKNARKEIENLEKVSSQGIIKLKKVKESKDYIFIHMELMEGSMEKLVGCKTKEALEFKVWCLKERYCADLLQQNLVDKAHRTKHIGIGLDWIQDLVKNLLEAISAIHEKGIVHNDIKLENILMKQDVYDYWGNFIEPIDRDFETICEPGNTKVTDFGCSEPDGENTVKGTMRNFAPECHINGTSAAGCQTQIYREHFDSLAQQITSRISRNDQDTKSTGIQDYMGITQKVDIWAVGLSASYMATGEDLFTESTRRYQFMQELYFPDKHDFKYTFHEAVRRMPEYLTNDPLFESFKEFLGKCLEHCPKDRLSAKELLKMDFITKNEKDNRDDTEEMVSQDEEIDNYVSDNKRARMDAPADCPDVCHKR